MAYFKKRLNLIYYNNVSKIVVKLLFPDQNLKSMSNKYYLCNQYPMV